MAALRATLQQQLALSAAVPERLAFRHRRREVAWRRTSLIPQHHRAAARHRSGSRQAGFHAGDLARTRFAAQLLHRLNDMIEAMDISFRQETAVGIERQRAVAGDAAALDERPALTFLAEPKPSSCMMML